MSTYVVIYLLSFLLCLLLSFLPLILLSSPLFLHCLSEGGGNEGGSVVVDGGVHPHEPAEGVTSGSVLTHKIGHPTGTVPVIN